MLQFEGDIDVQGSPAVVWAKLRTLPFLVSCIPDIEQVTTLTDEQAVCVLRPGFTFVRGTLQLTIHRLTEIPDEQVRFSFVSKGVGSSSEVEAVLAFSELGDATRLHWVATVKSLGGLLKMVPQGIIRAAAQKVMSDVLANVVKKCAAA